MKKQLFFLLMILTFCLSACKQDRQETVTTEHSENTAHSTDTDSLSLLKKPGCRIAVALGSAFDKFATENFTEADIFRMDGYPLVITMLERGRCEYGIMDEILARKIMIKDPAFEIAMSGFTGIDLGIGFRKENIKLRDDFNRFFETICNNGVHAQMIQRWSAHNWESASIPNLEPVDTHLPPLIVGTEGEAAPFNFISVNTYKGLDMELIQ